MQRMGTSRSAELQFVCQRRLTPTTDAERSTCHAHNLRTSHITPAPIYTPGRTLAGSARGKRPGYRTPTPATRQARAASGAEKDRLSHVPCVIIHAPRQSPHPTLDTRHSHLVTAVADRGVGRRVPAPVHERQRGRACRRSSCARSNAPLHAADRAGPPDPPPQK